MLDFKNRKVAIIHDDLMRRGGAEQVALALHKTFPNAPIYTMCYNAELTYPEFRQANIKTSLFQKFVTSEKWMKLLFYPLGFWCMRLMSVKGYDLVILSSTYASKYARIDKRSMIVNYCHNPFRLAWYPESYDLYGKAKGIKKIVLNFIISKLRKIDLKYSTRFNYTIVNSAVVKSRVEEIYCLKDCSIIHPPVNLANFDLVKTKGNDSSYFLVLSRLESYKKIDLVIEAFNGTNRKLVIVGNGSLKEQLYEAAGPNIIFKHNLSKIELANVVAGSRALIFPQKEDFGITPLEANASGIPVIAFGEGGILETMVPQEKENSTAIFFYEQEKESLKKAIQQFEQTAQTFNPKDLRKNAERFSLENFSLNLLGFLSQNTALDMK